MSYLKLAGATVVLAAVILIIIAAANSTTNRYPTVSFNFSATKRSLPLANTYVRVKVSNVTTETIVVQADRFQIREDGVVRHRDIIPIEIPGVPDIVFDRTGRPYWVAQIEPGKGSQFGFVFKHLAQKQVCVKLRVRFRPEGEAWVNPQLKQKCVVF